MTTASLAPRRSRSAPGHIRAHASRRPPLGRLVAGTDFSEPATRALARIALLPLDEKAIIHLVHVLPDALLDVAAPKRAARQALDEAASLLSSELRHARRADVEVRTALEQGRAWRELARVGDERHADLLVTGRRGERGLRDSLLGSVADRLVRTAGRPVLLVSAAPRRPYRHPAAAADLEDGPIAPVLSWALRLAEPLAQPLELVHAFDVPYGGLLRRTGITEAELREHRAEFRERSREALAAGVRAAAARVGVAPGEIAPIVRPGDPRRAIPQWAARRRVDLLSFATHARKGLARALLGSVAEELIRAAPCDCVVVPPASPRRS